MRTIINYSTSGLGNRLRPLASCWAISRQTGRRLVAYWDTLTPNGCLARWEDLFENPLETISLEQLESLDDCLLLTESGHGGHGFQREEQKFGRSALRSLAERNSYRDYNSFSFNDHQKNIIVYHNNFLPSVSMLEAYYFLYQLRPIQSIQQNINRYIRELGLDKTVYGIHARGTDFQVGIEEYIRVIDHILSINPRKQFFIATEDQKFEDTFKERYGNTVITRTKNNYIARDNPANSWSDHNGFSITRQHAQEAVEDLYLLAATEMVYYHPLSSFGQIANILSKQGIK